MRKITHFLREGPDNRVCPGNCKGWPSSRRVICEDPRRRWQQPRGGSVHQGNSR